MTTSATTKVLQPLPLTILLVGIVIIGTTFEGSKPIVIGLLILVMLDLLLGGYQNIHNAIAGALG